MDEGECKETEAAFVRLIASLERNGCQNLGTLTVLFYATYWTQLV
jgi:hypothetical protein